MLKISDVLNLSNEELREKETAIRKELMQLRFQAKTGKLERQASLKEAKRSIARILTVISQRRNDDASVPVKSVAPAKKEKITLVKKEKVEEKKSAKNMKKKMEIKVEKVSGETRKAKS